MSSDSDYSDGGWIEWFCNLPDHFYFCEVDEDYIRDGFNIYGLKEQFEHFNEAIQMILSSDIPDDDDLEDEQFVEIYQEAIDLYGLIHARFILTNRGLQMMREKYISGKFGVCPRVLCEKQAVLPVGMSEQLRTSRVKVFCPRCQEVYIPKNKFSDIDGAYFGISFPHLFLINYNELQPAPIYNTYVPRIYGFRVFEKKGSHFQDKSEQKKNEITYYGDKELKLLKNNINQKIQNNNDKNS